MCKYKGLGYVGITKIDAWKTQMQLSWSENLHLMIIDYFKRYLICVDVLIMHLIFTVISNWFILTFYNIYLINSVSNFYE